VQVGYQNISIKTSKTIFVHSALNRPAIQCTYKICGLGKILYRSFE